MRMLSVIHYYNQEELMSALLSVTRIFVFVFVSRYSEQNNTDIFQHDIMQKAILSEKSKNTPYSCIFSVLHSICSAR
jgi:hypothetical protein